MTDPRQVTRTSGLYPPAVILSMMIPRLYKIEMPDACLVRFGPPPYFFCDPRYSYLPIGGGADFVIADTILWVICIFPSAGPMLLSGFTPRRD